MELVERESSLILLHEKYKAVANGEGHCVFICGEAGIGKTSVIRAFCKEKEGSGKIYHGTCDPLFTPRPLAPLYDIAMQMQEDLIPPELHTADRTVLFTKFFQALANHRQPTIVVFEDVHWADEATLDFIKFLARRITQLRCLFIMTYRDNEIHPRHPFRSVLGQLSNGSFDRLQLMPLSREAVAEMAAKTAFNSEDVFRISGGNPFYVTEILASYSLGVPDNVKDSILSVYDRLRDATRPIWDMLSVCPSGLKPHQLKKIEPSYEDSIGQCLDLKILVVDGDRFVFKHELYRRTIEASLSPLVRVQLHKKILAALREDLEVEGQIEQIVHHAKNGNEYELVVQYAPLAAERAACVGAHIEASKLYFSCIEYYQGSDPEMLIRFYELYAYECYLTSQIGEAIVFTGKAMSLREKKNDWEGKASSMRFLSRLWWFDGNRKKALDYGKKAIAAFESLPLSKAKAMAYSNMSQLMMLSDQPYECKLFGEQAIAMAKELSDEETLSHALNNVGDVKIRMPSSQQQGLDFLHESLSIALKNSFHEHAARAYTNLGHNAIIIKDHELARKVLTEGIIYCEKRDLGSWSSYIQALVARMELETGNWNEAARIAESLLKNEALSPVVRLCALPVLGAIKMRRGEDGALNLLTEAKDLAFETMELQRIIPALAALLEYEWITATQVIDGKKLEATIVMMQQMGNIYENSEFAFWLKKARKRQIPLQETYPGYETGSRAKAAKAASLWEKAGSPYMHALSLMDGDDDDKRKAIAIIQGLGATTVYEKLKMEMRAAGIKKIPQGMRKTTRSNVAMLTSREIDVLHLLKEGMHNKEIASKLFISAKTVDHHISSLLFKLDASSRAKAVQEAIKLEIIK